jgi:peroxiredoxin Q/BCP
LPATGGRTVRLSDYRGRKTVVLFFYPKDETLGCTAQSCTFRDVYEDFVSAGVEIIGVSADSIASHERFGAKNRLPYRLVSDAGGEVASAYGVRGGFLNLGSRVTFVIDREGVVQYAFSSMVRVKAHVSRALAIVRDLNAAAPLAAAHGP